MLGARRGVHTGYVAASERSGALLIGAERLAEGAGLLLIGQVEQSVQYVVNGRHVLVLHLVGSPQVVAGERLEQREPSCSHEWPSRDKRRRSQVLAREPAVGRILLLAGLMHPADSLDQHLVLASRW